MIEKLGMPKWGLSMTEGRLIDWLVEEGAEIAVGDEVAEVETEKINGVVEAPVAGVLRRRVGATGTVIPVGGLLGVIADASVSDAEIDAFVADFEASFVPGESDEDAAPEPARAGDLRYLLQGEGGEPLVLLHGFGGDLDNWLFNAPALSGERAVYALDLPGHGGSVKEARDLVGALREFLDSQGLDRVHLAGHSMGGLVAGEFAASSPDRVLSLTLIAPAGLGDEINASYIDGFVAAAGRKELKPVLQQLFADPSLVTRSMVDDVLKYKRLDGVQGALEGLRDQLFAGGSQARSLDLDAYPGPVLVVWGADDAIIPAAHAEHAPSRADVHVLDGVGHSPHMESAGEVNRLVEGFLTGVRT
ncbi:acetoin dehydrogenase dihydrolipoyllysine-residue acetyltransferase subunit [Solirubrobacter soli]|uniref:acetoin dehydrogenase dihydrolipoyllysine-residue acetyltransferase subunit n=1 Tax=Solirubrobacter soli TaxID=363832 RepID=UPI00041A5BBA|nr:acetoin dehydrogenase dihydrolipoyllysine-residue acetyltransferase subunit [Solirubrobacter soli]